MAGPTAPGWAAIRVGVLEARNHLATGPEAAALFRSLQDRYWEYEPAA